MIKAGQLHFLSLMRNQGRANQRHIRHKGQRRTMEGRIRRQSASIAEPNMPIACTGALCSHRIASFFWHEANIPFLPLLEDNPGGVRGSAANPSYFLGPWHLWRRILMLRAAIPVAMETSHKSKKEHMPLVDAYLPVGE